jgi:hypothetical protein
MSDTPRTLAKVAELEHLPPEFRAAGIALLCLTLERELAEAYERAAKVCEKSSGVGAIPETDAYANGWNDCRKEAFGARQRSATIIRALAAASGTPPENEEAK